MSQDTELVEVHMLGYPLALRERSSHQGADLVRELALLVGGQSSGGTAHPVPQRLVEVATELQELYGPFIESTIEEIEAAADRGEHTLDRVVYRLPRSAAAFVRHVAEVLDEADAYCRAGEHLLMLAAPAEISAYRAWVFGEVQRQIGGEEPLSWPDHVAARRD